MKDHPLTPMRDANLMRLLQAQSRHRCGLIRLQRVREGAAAIGRCVDRLKAEGISYGVVDAVDDDDLALIGAAAAEHKLVTGGSGVALGLPENFRRQGKLGPAAPAALPAVSGRELVLAGSCAEATRTQIDRVKDLWPQQKVNVDAIAAGDDVVAALADWAATQDAGTPLLIYASAAPEEVAQIQARHGVEAAGRMVEEVIGRLAHELVAAGFTRLVVAGGETSGAVVSALGVGALAIGAEIDPGVPWTETLAEPRIALALKSGNFGGEDFFAKAFKMLA